MGGRAPWVIWLGGLLALAGCYPTYRPPVVGVPQAEIDIVNVPNPLLCIDGLYYVPASFDVYKPMRVPAGRPIGVRARLQQGTRVACAPGVSFTPRAGASYNLDFKFNYAERLCALELHDKNPPPSNLTGPLVLLSSLTDLDDMRCETD